MKSGRDLLRTASMALIGISALSLLPAISRAAMGKEQVSSPASAEAGGTSPSLQAGAFTVAQANQGITVYRPKCAVCHGGAMKGGAGPALVGPEFVGKWQDKKISELYTLIHETMPAGSAGSLSAESYTNVLAAILRANGFAAGNEDLTSETMEKLTISSPALNASAPAK